MTRLAIFLILLFPGIKGITQQYLDSALKNQLDSILVSDQGVRQYLDARVTEARKDSLSVLLGYSRKELDRDVWGIVKIIDSLNLAKVELIIQKYGYPGKSIVGEPTNTAVFYVIQHAHWKIPVYYKLIRRAGKREELPYRYVAMMLDRMRTGKGKRQVYGTQGYSVMVWDPLTGEKKPFSYIIPIKNPKKVNKRRQKAGFETTVEENARNLGIQYIRYTRKEIKRIIEAGKSKSK